MNKIRSRRINTVRVEDWGGRDRRLNKGRCRRINKGRSWRMNNGRSRKMNKGKEWEDQGEGGEGRVAVCHTLPYLLLFSLASAYALPVSPATGVQTVIKWFVGSVRSQCFESKHAK